MHMEIEQKDNKREFSEKKTGERDSRVTEDMNELGLEKKSSKRKSYRIMDRLNNLPNNHKYFKNKKQ